MAHDTKRDEQAECYESDNLAGPEGGSGFRAGWDSALEYAVEVLLSDEEMQRFLRSDSTYQTTSMFCAGRDAWHAARERLKQ